MSIMLFIFGLSLGFIFGWIGMALLTMVSLSKQGLSKVLAQTAESPR